mmetsp:Transcript_16179/g.35077  ORF Transcript_16179/g.35077 Transcript_16179/m.35077 type:complete len:213 (+) Transcript_16179:559-1197(+)
MRTATCDLIGCSLRALQHRLRMENRLREPVQPRALLNKQLMHDRGHHQQRVSDVCPWHVVQIVVQAVVEQRRQAPRVVREVGRRLAKRHDRPLFSLQVKRVVAGVHLFKRVVVFDLKIRRGFDLCAIAALPQVHSKGPELCVAHRRAQLLHALQRRFCMRVVVCRLVMATLDHGSVLKHKALQLREVLHAGVSQRQLWTETERRRNAHMLMS